MRSKGLRRRGKGSARLYTEQHLQMTGILLCNLRRLSDNHLKRSVIQTGIITC